MRKITALIVCLCMVLCQLSIMAFAADAVAVYDLATTSVSITGQSVAADNIDIIVFKTGDTMIPENCIHVNQVKCDENGEFAFDFSMPALADTANYTIYMSGKDKVVFTETFYHQNVSGILNELKSATTVTAFRSVLTSNSNLFTNEFVAAPDDVIALILGEEFDTIAGYEQYFEKMTKLYNFKKSDPAGMKAIYDADGAELGITMFEDYADLTDKTNVFAVAKENGFDIKDITSVNNALIVGVIFTLLKDGGTLKLDKIVNYVKNNYTLVGITEAIANDNKLSSALRKMIDTDILSISVFAEKLAEALNDNTPAGVVNRPTGGGGGGGGTSIKPASGNIPLDVAPAPGPVKKEFSDLDNVSWAVEAITSLAEKGIISGVSDTEFAPDANVTREQFVKMFVLALGISAEDGAADFTDLAASHWSYSYISAAVGAGIVNGVGADSFGMGQNITREDMAVMLYRAVSVARIALTEKTDVSFADNTEIADYAVDAVETMAKAGIINGSDGKFMPKAFATRAQAAKMIYEILSVKEGA